MVELTVSTENLMTLMDAHPKERVCIKHKNVSGEVWLQKLYDKKPAVHTEQCKVPEIGLIDTDDPVHYRECLSAYLADGYKVQSTSCSDGYWRAILLKEV